MTELISSRFSKRASPDASPKSPGIKTLLHLHLSLTLESRFPLMGSAESVPLSEQSHVASLFYIYLRRSAPSINSYQSTLSHSLIRIFTKRILDSQ